MQKQFDNILSFTKLKDKCLFCQEVLRANLTNFTGLRNNGLPILAAPLESGRFTFKVKHTTENYNIKADAVIDIVTNALVFTLPVGAETPFLDQHVARQAFTDLKPHVELYCSNRKCKNRYSITSSIFDIRKVSYGNINANVWAISQLKLFLETFKTGNLIVQNDWIKEDTCIYSTMNEEADPIRVPIIDFESMGKDKLITRIKTLVTFS